MNNIPLKDIMEYIVAIGIILSFVTAFIAWIHSIWTHTKKIYRICDILQKEFKVNGGSSLKDALNRIEQSQRDIKLLQLAIYTFWDIKYSEPMFICSSFGYCLWANKSYLKLIGRTENEIVGSKWESMIHQEDREAVIEEWYNACSDGRSFEFTYRINTTDGEILTVKCKTYGDKENGYIGFITKI